MSFTADPIAAASASAMTDLSAVQTPATNSDPATVSETPAAVATPDPEPAPAAGSEPSIDPQAEPVAAAEAAAQQAARELELIWRGQKVRLPEPEVISLAQKGYDYSQKTAELSQIRQELQTREAAIQQQANDLRQVLSDPQQLRQLAEWAAQQSGAQLDPNAGVTAQQAEQLIAANVQKLQTQMQGEIKRAHLELETNRLEQEYTTTVGNHLQGLAKKYPVLQDVEGIDAVLRQEALAWHRAQLEANPNKEIGVQDVLAVMTKAAERRAQKIEARFTNQLKQMAVQKQVVQETGIDAGGSPPAPQANPSHKLNSKELREQVLRDLGVM